MRFTRRLTASLVLAVLLLGGVARAASPTSPALLSADPADGAKLDRAPASATLTFSQPIEAHYSRLEIYDSCGNRLDEGSSTVSVNSISTVLKRKPAGRYKLYYFINGIPKGTTGETDGTLTFTVKKGRRCS